MKIKTTVERFYCPYHGPILEPEGRLDVRGIYDVCPFCDTELKVVKEYR